MGKRKNIVIDNLLVTGYAAEGKCLAKHEGKVIFMENAVPGDIVTVRLIKNKKDWAQGQVIQITGFSEERIAPFCKHFGICGGCQWQMLPYEKQLEYKQDQVLQSLKRIGKLELPEIMPILGSEKTTGYRNKLEYTFSSRRYLLKEELADPEISTFQNAAGFHARGIFDKIVDIDTCWLQDEPTNDIRKEIKRWALEKGITFYDIHRHEGFLRNVQVRLCRSGEIMVNIVFGYEDETIQTGLLQHIKDRFPSITTLLYTINRKWNDSLNELNPVVFHGKGYVIENLERFSFKIGPKSFFQTNTAQADDYTRRYAVLRH